MNKCNSHQRFGPVLQKQTGQALVLGLALICVALLGVFLMFNAGQVVATKARLVNATDAAAYSAGVVRARALNFAAYANRAIVAQEVAVAQAVTLVSYAQFIESFTQNAASVLSPIPGVGSAMATWATVAAPARVAAEAAAKTEIPLRAAADVGYKALLEKSQALILTAANTIAMSATATEVVKANDPKFFAHAIRDVDSWDTGFIKHYTTDPERQTLKSVVMDSLDGFIKGPRYGYFWPIPTVLGGCWGIPWPGHYTKGGGTVLSTAGSGYDPDGNPITTSGLERWEAADSSSIHTVRNGGFLGLSCNWRENLPLGWGAAETATTLEGRLLDYPGNVLNNRRAVWISQTQIPSDPGFDQYSGISRVRDLDYDTLNYAKYPTRRIAIFGQVKSNEVRTTKAARIGTGFFNMSGVFAADKLSALAAAEIFFERPATAPARTEYASLYNPYWQVRLVNPTPVERAKAEALYVDGQADDF